MTVPEPPSATTPTGARRRVAIVGSGVSGLVCAYLLREKFEVTLYEADSRLGGHAHTVQVDGGDGIYPVDTGFLVYTEATYPNLIKLFAELDIPTQPSVMSFSYRDDVANVEWKGSSLATVFAQKRNLLRLNFWRMLRDIVRFNALLTALIADPSVNGDVTLGEFLATHRASQAFRDWYLVPMGAAIWSANPEHFLSMPAKSFAAFFSRHGLLNVRGMPAWRTVSGGSRHYVDAIATAVTQSGQILDETPVRLVERGSDHVVLHTDAGNAAYDHVIFACHSDQALALLAAPTNAEKEILGAIAYQDNEVTLHWDETLLPRRKTARAAWNYLRHDPHSHVATLTYNISTLQSITAPREFLVSLNSRHLIDSTKVLGEFHYAHPVLDDVTVAAQRRRDEVQTSLTSYCGAYWGFGFHEDGARSAVEVCAALGVTW